MEVDAVETLVAQIRDHYVDQFREFANRQRKLCARGAAEVRFFLPGETNAFDRMVIVDFVRNDDGAEGVVFLQDSVLSFDPLEGTIGQTTLVISGLRWDAAILLHDVADVSMALNEWFVKWCDPDETRVDPEAEFSGCIHAVFVEAGELEVDFGTAPPAAFWELLTCLAEAGATGLGIRAG